MSSDEQESFKSKSVCSETPPLDKDEEIINENSNEKGFLSGEDSDSFPISGGRNYIKKIRERFELSNDMINKELIKADLDDMARNMIKKLTKSGSQAGFEEPKKLSRRSRRSVISSRAYDDMISQIDTESLAPSRKVKRKKARKVKRVVSKHSVVDETATVISNPKSQPGSKRTKVVHNKVLRKQAHKVLFRNPSIDLKNYSNGGRESSSSHENVKTESDAKVERNKSYTKINTPNIKLNDNTAEKIYEGISRTHNFTKNGAEDVLLNNLNLILESNNIIGNKSVNGNFDKHLLVNQIGDVDCEDDQLQFLKHMNGYELPTIASRMKTVNRGASNRNFESSRTPFVVGTSITVTNNLYLLKQQIASKMKTLCLSHVNEDQLSGWNVNSLRLLIQSIDKLSGAHKLRSTYRSKQNISQPTEEENCYGNELQ